MVRRPDAGQHQQLWRTNGACTKDDLALGALLGAALALLNAKGHCATLFQNDVKHLHGAPHGEVGALPYGLQERIGGAAALSLELCDLVKAEPFLLRAI